MISGQTLNTQENVDDGSEKDKDDDNNPALDNVEPVVDNHQISDFKDGLNFLWDKYRNVGFNVLEWTFILCKSFLLLFSLLVYFFFSKNQIILHFQVFIYSFSNS